MKIAIWAEYPSPHQKDFYTALRDRDVDLRVCYLRSVSEERRRIGWSQPSALPADELTIPENRWPLDLLPDWRQRIHVIPGYSCPRLLNTAVQLSRHQVPWIHWSENSQPRWRSYITWLLKRWYAGLVNRHALGAFAIGEAATRDFRRWGIRAELIAPLYYSIHRWSLEGPVDAQVQQFSAGRLTMVYVGSLIPLKACDTLLRAFAAATRCSGEGALVLVGDGSHRAQYQRLASQLGLADRVLFRGVLPREQVASVLRACQVLILPSHYDGWGVVLNEAASLGLALIASERVGAAEHLIEAGVNGLRVRAGSVDSLAWAMGSYLRDPGLAACHGLQSRLRFQDFSPSRNAQRFTATIRTWLAAERRWEGFFQTDHGSKYWEQRPRAA